MLDFGCNIMCSMCSMFLIRNHEFLFPATKGHLPRRSTFAPNPRWPLVAGTTVSYSRCILASHWTEHCRIKHISKIPKRKSEQETTSSQTKNFKMGSHSNHTQVVRSSTMLVSCRVRLLGVGALHPCKETACDTE